MVGLNRRAMGAAALPGGLVSNSTGFRTSLYIGRIRRDQRRERKTTNLGEHLNRGKVTALSSLDPLSATAPRRGAALTRRRRPDLCLLEVEPTDDDLINKEPLDR